MLQSLGAPQNKILATPLLSPENVFVLLGLRASLGAYYVRPSLQNSHGSHQYSPVY